MIFELSDDKYESLVWELEAIVRGLLIDVEIHEDFVKVIRLKTLVDTANDPSYIANLAEYLRMNKTTTAKLKDIVPHIRETAGNYGIQVTGLIEIQRYIDTLCGEMSMQDAFPRSAPSWWLYHVDPEYRWST